jgi:glycosyltransferase involved in cell wall biosynthesis
VRILQVSNLASHHQLPLARSLAAQLTVRDFRFASMSLASKERRELGWDVDEAEPWLLRPAEHAPDRCDFDDWWDNADIVLCGERRLDRFARRLEEGKLTLYMSERWWKPPIGRARLFYPPFLKMALRFRNLAQSRFLHFLSCGAYAARDIHLLAPFLGRTWRWGYFPPEADSEPHRGDDTDEVRILWAGRMLSWKRLDTLLRAFAVLCRRDLPVRLTLVGHGPCERRLKRLARSLGVVGRVDFRPSCSAGEVRLRMREADLYVLPSDGREGWGAVVNEAMSEGCVVAATCATGSAPELIRHGLNGYLFKVGDWRGLAEILHRLVEQPQERLRVGMEARRTVAGEWSPPTAARRLLSVSEALIGGRPTPTFKSGPMSVAE